MVSLVVELERETQVHFRTRIIKVFTSMNIPQRCMLWATNWCRVCNALRTRSMLWKQKEVFSNWQRDSKTEKGSKLFWRNWFTWWILCRSKVALSWFFRCCLIICLSRPIAAGKPTWKWRLPRRYRLGRIISRAAWRCFMKGHLCRSVLGLYCRLCKLDEPKNCRLDGSCSRTVDARVTLQMLLQPWDRWKQKLEKIIATYTLALEECVSPRCSRLCCMRRMTSCVTDWLQKWKHSDSFDQNSNIHVQFTSNHEDYMHRGDHPIMKAEGCEQHGETKCV